MRHISHAVLMLFCTLLLFASSPLARPESSPEDASDASGQIFRRDDRDEHMRQLEREQAKARNKQRQEDLKKDTDKLLQLATDLKLAVDRSSEQTLSVDVLKKAEEVEKLAKNIQKKMKAE